MNIVLQFFVLIPLLAFIVSIIIPEKKEKQISWMTFGAVLIQLTLLVAYIVTWIVKYKATSINFIGFKLFENKDINFFIDFYFDKITAVYLFVGAFLTLLITTYSRYYLHREKGYKRFFNTILFFFFGYNLAILSGNFETLFMGWEVIGISSFLLIAFYRERYLPVRNAFKVFAIYRIGDVGIILAMWASHHLFHKNILFNQLSASTVSEQVHHHAEIGFFIAMCLACSAAVKSAQIPFSSWLPKAMEGPTPSSAIFYGSLSVHLGVFLMMRTFPLWQNEVIIRIAIGLMGLTTSFMASQMAKVQSSIKSQIAYSSISQIGLIFIEIALGFNNLALIHFAGNAFLRTYQLLVSPSVVSYLIREQFYNFEFVDRKEPINKKITYSLYILALKEFNLDKFLNIIIWKPLKSLGKTLDFLNLKLLIFLFIPLYALGIISYEYHLHLPEILKNNLPEVFAGIGWLFVFKSFSERKSPFMAWLLIVLNHFWIAIAILFNDKVSYNEIFIYLSGIVIAGFIGYIALFKLKKIEPEFHLNKHLGHVYEHPIYAFLFLIATLGVTGFPITTTFIGEDLIFSHVQSNQFLLAFFIANSFIVSGISGIRIYTRIFLGPHVKTYHELPYQSA